MYRCFLKKKNRTMKKRDHGEMLKRAWYLLGGESQMVLA